MSQVNVNNDAANYFVPNSRNCSCCQGFVYRCGCVFSGYYQCAYCYQHTTLSQDASTLGNIFQLLLFLILIFYLGANDYQYPQQYYSNNQQYAPVDPYQQQYQQQIYSRHYVPPPDYPAMEVRRAHSDPTSNRYDNGILAAPVIGLQFNVDDRLIEPDFQNLDEIDEVYKGIDIFSLHVLIIFV
jgi:hypothetical protein